MEKSHIWLGNFPSRERYLDYMKEIYAEDDNVPINKFAADQGVGFYDTDWEESFFSESGDLRELISLGSYSDSYIDDVIMDAVRKGIDSANTFIIVDADEIKNPKSITRDDYSLTYIGEYKCNV